MKKRIYTFNEAYKASHAYFKWDELAAKVWVSKYALKDSDGNIYEESPRDMHWRMAKEFRSLGYLVVSNIQILLVKKICFIFSISLII